MKNDGLLNELFKLQDKEYSQFHSKLIPNISKEKIIGIRTPVLRKFAKDFLKSYDAKSFLNRLPHQYYEENNLHAFLIEQIKDYDTLILELDKFLPFVDNWATCDMMRPKILKKHTAKLLQKAKEWIKSKHPYTVRFGIEMLMIYFLDNEFSPELPKIISQIKSDEYYVNMMIAWYFATALAKQYDNILPFITDKKLPTWIHNKTIQKAIESYRITNEQKAILKTLKIKTER